MTRRTTGAYRAVAAATVFALGAGLTAAAAGAEGSSTAGGHVFALLRSAATASDVSANWAGYATTGGAVTYTSATATWQEPTVTCAAGDAGAASAFWVGLGGYSVTSQGLEQVGTSADCDPETGKPTYYAWYELVPSPSVTIKHLVVHPGDVITASVNVLGGSTAELQVKNRTRRTSFTTKLPLTAPDLTSAEWIAEAPSSCDQFRCRPIPLANFGSVGFSKIAALGSGTGGTLTANPGWTTTAITLTPTVHQGFFPGRDSLAGSAGSTAGATPSALSADGRSFTVQWTGTATGSTSVQSGG
jgi:hypothetical protein